MSARIVVGVVVINVVGCVTPPDAAPAPSIDVDACAAGTDAFPDLHTRDCAIEFEDTGALPFVVDNRGEDDLHISAVFFDEGSDPAFTINVAPEAVDPGDSVVVVIGFAPVVEGDVSAVVHVISDAANAADVAVTIVGHHTRCRGDIEIVPASCDFGDVEVGADAAFCDLSINNVGACDLLVDDIGFDDTTPFPAVFGPQGVVIVPLSIPAGGSVPLRMYGKAEDATTSTGTLIVHSLDSDESEVRVPLRLNGVAP